MYTLLPVSPGNTFGKHLDSQMETPAGSPGPHVSPSGNVRDADWVRESAGVAQGERSAGENEQGPGTGGVSPAAWIHCEVITERVTQYF